METMIVMIIANQDSREKIPQNIVVLKTTVNLKNILLIVITTIARVLITEWIIRRISEAVMKKIIIVMKITYKANDMEEWKSLTWTRNCQVKTHENIFYWRLPALNGIKKLKKNNLNKKL